MQGLLFDHIQNLDKSRSDWRIKVRCTRAWPTVAMETSVVRGYNFIFLDEDNSHIHAYAYPDNWTAIGKEMVEGNEYVVENFQVRDALGRLKPASNKLCIRLLRSTVIQEQSNDFLIPSHKFEFFDLGDLVDEDSKVSNDENPEFAIDVLGAIDEFIPLKKIPTKIGEREVVRFSISDGRKSYKVAAWGNLAIAINADFKPDLETPVIAIISIAKITEFKGNTQIGTLPSTKVYFNLDIEPVSEFRALLLEEGYTAGGHVHDGRNSVSAPPLEFSSFARLVSSPGTLSQRSVLATFTVNKIEEEDNWWFRILVLADDTTHACNVVLMDRVVKRIAGTTATNILNEMKKAGFIALNVPSGAFITDLYGKIVGKEISAKIDLSEANLNGDSNIYEAVDLWDPSAHQLGAVERTPESSSSLFIQPDVVHGIELF
ncbi:hypothetical protein DCAR_0727797 [Daucus carota subsp. sativus]|uniref:Replication protein A 70 kDa DNA-binding subunit B/D first OB fold domain-containing protein n=1 Tax=Daucus carota subsp. sativus TaxID=79200 RepID=A0A161ZLL4_DAUCS|nr:hypothetical protein DCAR_0727797 [Daucus carota subsp. sativus]